MTAYEQGFMKMAEDLGVGRDIAYGMMKSAVSRPVDESERNERRKRINKILATVMLGLVGATAGASVNGISK